MTITPLDAWVKEIISNNITNDKAEDSDNANSDFVNDASDAIECSNISIGDNKDGNIADRDVKDGDIADGEIANSNTANGAVKSGAVLRTDIQAYQLECLNATLQAAQNSPYYRRSLIAQTSNTSEQPLKRGAAVPAQIPSTSKLTRHGSAAPTNQAKNVVHICQIQSLSELALLPTIDAGTVKEEGTRLVCAPQSEIARIVTLQTSGSTDSPKRVFFTEHDLELTVDYFTYGLKTLISAGDSMAILLPCERPDGVGDLIARGLARIPVTPVRHGLVSDIAGCVNVLRMSNAKSLVAAPVQALAVARYCYAKNIKLNISTVLLSTDNIPRIVVSELERLLSCEVFEHYGMTEMGLGGAIDCEAHDGYHIRENDLFIEILDEKGRPVRDGEYGEVVFTTLTREGMPLIRYKTGDRSKLLPGRCVCGSILNRVAPLKGRIGGDVIMECGTVLRMHEFDEVLFAIPEVSGFTLTAQRGKNKLEIALESQESVGVAEAARVSKALKLSGLIDGLDVTITVTLLPDTLPPMIGKRIIAVIA